MQLIYKEKSNWDSLVSDEIVTIWNSFIDCLKLSSAISIPRFICMEGKVSIQIHGFCDSSMSAYCAAVYVRRQSESKICVNLLAAKTRVAPLKELTIPRLELVSCQLLVELLSVVVNSLKSLCGVKIFCWSDSEVSLCWIRGVHKQWNTWVENRVIKIRKEVEPNSWYHVPGSLNPADVATRSISAKDLTCDSVWFTGPQFLYISRDQWPNTHIDEDSAIEGDNVAPTVNLVHMEDEDMVIPVTKFSDIHRLLTVVVHILRFKHNMLSCIRNQEKRVGEINVTEIVDAETLLIKQEQSLITKSEKFKLIKRSLNLFLDEASVLRVKGRLENSQLEFEEKFPILLNDSHFSHLLIKKCHLEVMHGGTEATLNQFRSRFWIVRGRQVVKRVIYRCVVCRRQQGKVLIPPPSPALPSYRVASDFCFQSTGVDFAGALLVKSIYFPDRNQLHKSYICLFTCAASRALHLELVPNLEAQTFIRALQRFFARRGYPKVLVSDNAKTFTCHAVKRFLVDNKIEKKFILPASPWWGGFYERLVRSVKLPLRKILGKARLSYEELETVLIQIEAVVNSRPLTYLYDDEVLDPLTPSHLLTGRNILQKCEYSKLDVEFVNSVELGKRATYIQRTIQLFWNKFQHCYLAELREHHMYQNKENKANRSLKVDDVVIVKDDILTPRSSWRIARVKSLIIGRDGNVRGGVLSAISQDGKRTTLTRPLQKLIPLEVTETSSTHADSENIDNDNDIEGHALISDKKNTKLSKNNVNKRNDNVKPPVSCRPRRVAAEAGELARRTKMN